MMQRGWVILLVTILLALITDQASKYEVIQLFDLHQKRVIPVFDPYLRFVLAWNRGINFGLFGSGSPMHQYLLIGLAVVVSILVAYWAVVQKNRWFTFGAGLLVGGALGNAIDRFLHGAVVDFININGFGIDNPYSFNLADTWIFFGAVLIVLKSSKSKT